MAKDKNPYAEFENYTNRLRVETTYGPNDVRDHRDGFTQKEYRRNMQDGEKQEKMSGFPPMKSVTTGPKPKAAVKRKRSNTDDAGLNQALDKDLSKRNVR